MKLTGTISASWSNASQNRSAALSYIQSVLAYPISITSEPTTSSWIVAVDFDSEPSAISSTTLKHICDLRVARLGMSISWD